MQEDARYIIKDEEYFSPEQRKRTRKRSREMAERTIGNMRKGRNRAHSISYFEDIVGYDGSRVKELREFHEKDGKIVGTLCAMVPVEVIGALGAQSIRICSGYYECVHPSNELLGDAGLCPMVKSTLGSKMLSADPLMDMLDLVVAPATCDGKMKLGEMLEDWVPVVMLNVPRIKTGDTTSKFWLEEIKFLIRRLEDLTGTRLKRTPLLQEIKRWNAANQAWKDFMEIRSTIPSVVTGQDAMIVARASELDDIARWTGKVGELNHELHEIMEKEGYAGEKGAARIMLAGSPVIFPNFKIPSIIEESGGIVAHDELCSANRILEDPVMVDETNTSEIIRALAERYFYPCTCPCFSPNDERIRRLKESIRLYQIEGVIFHTLRGCHLNTIEGTKIELALDTMGVPMLKLESEYDDGDVEQIRTRAEAFVEMIKARRK
jgi:benzoyl-CoA reductase/2-hydroxyglutaryl-CoA dehydratase subunit BcrC/BadD/HgdB